VPRRKLLDLPRGPAAPANVQHWEGARRRRLLCQADVRVLKRR